MVGTKKSERIFIRAYLPRRPLRLTAHQGFSLIELSIVLIIIGLIMTAGVTIFRSSILSTRLSTTKTNLDNIKTSVISFAMAYGRLPCSDTVAPPNNQGISASDPATCGTLCSCNCANPPCYVPFQTLKLQLPGGKDSFSNVFFYDISYDNVGAQGGLTNTTTDTFCGVLYEYMAQPPVPPVPAQPMPYVTNPGGQGYGVAAVIISETPIDNVFSVQPPPPLPSLTGKNAVPHGVAVARQYEMASAANGLAYGDLVAELTYSELYNKVCTMQKTKIRIQNYSGVNLWATVNDTGCVPVQGTPAVGFIDILQGTTIKFYNNGSCTAICGTGIGTQFTFTMSSANTDAGWVDWNSGTVRARDGRVQIPAGAACATLAALNDNTNVAP